ncbi:MAG: peptidylprolyl isomerase [Eubacteriales bacterium]|nr:peptidylprolyl isomerase [Eubacteriales bacterium]
MKRILLVLLAVLMVATVFAGCKDDTIYTSTTETTKQNTGDNTTETTKSEVITMTYEEAYEYQTRDPEQGETIAIIHTDFGDISMRFLDKVAPVAVENFITLAKDGKYDETIFHRVISNFMIQGGDYTNFNGTGGESAFGHEFDNECVENISNITGSVAMANAGPDTNGSQFYINQVDNTYLDGGYTVFGWVYDGMDVVDAIAAVQTDPYDKPVEDVVVQSVEVLTYEG